MKGKKDETEIEAENRREMVEDYNWEEVKVWESRCKMERRTGREKKPKLEDE